MEELFSFCRIPPGSIPLKPSSSPILYKSSADYDTIIKLITISAWIGLTSINALTVYFAITKIQQLTTSTLVIALTAVPTLGVLLIGYLFSPRSFELTLNGIAIKRPIKSFEIPYREILNVKRVGWSWRHLRLFGSGGLYGFFGLFQFSGLGRVWTYVTNRHKVVLVETKGGTKYLISPEDPEAFLEKFSFLKEGGK